MRQQTTTDDRGQMSANRAVQLVVALAVFGIIASVLAPVALDAITEDDSESFTGVSEGDTVEVKEGILNATLDNTAGDETNITVTVTDVDSGSTAQATNITDGSSQEVTLQGETITITNDDSAASTADFTVAFPPNYGWSGGAGSLWNVLDLAIVLVLFLFVVGMAMMARNRAV